MTCTNTSRFTSLLILLPRCLLYTCSFLCACHACWRVCCCLIFFFSYHLLEIRLKIKHANRGLPEENFSSGNPIAQCSRKHTLEGVEQYLWQQKPGKKAPDLTLLSHTTSAVCSLMWSCQPEAMQGKQRAACLWSSYGPLADVESTSIRKMYQEGTFWFDVQFPRCSFQLRH